MPYLISEEDELKKAVNNISGASNVIGGQAVQPNAAPKAPGRSGSYTNLNAYLDANKEQAGQMGSTITQGVEDKAQAATGNINNFIAEKPSAVAAADPNKYLADPVKNTAQDVVDYGNLKSTGGYTGPQELSQTKNYQSAFDSTSKAKEAVDASGTEEGRMNLLKDTYARPNYQRGAQTLDNALIQKDEGSKQKFADINQRYSGLSSMFDNAANDVGNSINSNKAAALANKTAIGAAETSAWDNVINPIQNRVVRANQDNSGLISRVGADIKDDVLSDETLNLLGLKEGQNLYDMSIDNYVTPDNTQVGIDNVATPEERSRYAALVNLIGDPSRTQLTADGKQINPVMFDAPRFNADMSGKKAEYENAYKNYRSLYPDGPGQWTSAVGATPEYIENVVIPDLEAKNLDYPHPHYSQPLSELKTLLADWKSKYQPNRTIKKG